MPIVNSFAVYEGADYPIEPYVLEGIAYGDPINVLTGMLDAGGGDPPLFPGTTDVRDGTFFGYVSNPTQFEGSLAVPSPTRVIDGVATDNTVGSFVYPTKPNVYLGYVYGSGGEFVGELDTGCPAPSDPSLAFWTGKVVDELGEPEEGVAVQARFVCWPTGDDGIAYDAAIQEQISDAGGVVTFQLVKGATYQIRRGDSQKWYRFDVSVAPSGTLPSFIGIDAVVAA